MIELEHENKLKLMPENKPKLMLEPKPEPEPEPEPVPSPRKWKKEENRKINKFSEKFLVVFSLFSARKRLEPAANVLSISVCNLGPMQ